MRLNTASLSRALAALALTLFLATCASAPQTARGEAVVVAANPHAVAAGEEIIRAGGNATDAAIAAMLVLGLVEPQSAGLGGGGFLLAYDASDASLDAYDGREIAPAGATNDMFLVNGQPMQFLDAQQSGRSIGAPALAPMLYMAHRQHGRLAWARLFEPAIRLAEGGFAVSPRLNMLIAGYAARGRLRDQPDAARYLLTPEGEPLPVGHILRNPDYAATLRALARQGPRALTHGPIAEAIVAAAQRAPRAGTLTLADLLAVRPRRVDALCGAVRVYRVCTLAPPSAGGFAVLQTLALFERARPTPGGVESVDDWAALLWASRLAYADRDYFGADDQFAPVPAHALVSATYLDERARLIDLARAPGEVTHGDPTPRAARWGGDATIDAPGTTHLSVIDHEGNIAALTASVENVFGSQRMAGGFFLNNQLTDFSFRPEINGAPVANAVAPRKRPRSSMAPTIMFGADGRPYAVMGSPGGPAIPAYVARTLIGMTDWSLSTQQSIDLGHLIAAGATVRSETERVPGALAEALTARGWRLAETQSEASGLHGFRIVNGAIDAGADPRREGRVARIPAMPPAN
ncbi:MAG: gamma-glutamyltransferase family protein [Hyphomonadaceae bacterium]